jgi:hypothetical protein
VSGKPHPATQKGHRVAGDHKKGSSWLWTFFVDFKQPGFISNLKYLAAHKNWDGSFQWLAQFVRDNAGKLAQAKVLGGLAATVLGGIMLFNQGSDDKG